MLGQVGCHRPHQGGTMNTWQRSPQDSPGSAASGVGRLLHLPLPAAPGSWPVRGFLFPLASVGSTAGTYVTLSWLVSRARRTWVRARHGRQLSRGDRRNCNVCHYLWCTSRARRSSCAISFKSHDCPKRWEWLFCLTDEEAEAQQAGASGEWWS